MKCVCVRLATVNSYDGETLWYWRCYSCNASGAKSEWDLGTVIKQARRHVRMCRLPTTEMSGIPGELSLNWLLGFK